MTQQDMIAVASNIDGMREQLLTLSNTTVDGEYIFTGSNTTKKTYQKDNDYNINGKIDFGGNAHLRDIAVEPGVYRNRGVTAHDVLMYNTDTSANDGAITFTEEEIVIDQ
jgi:flagellar hook-associated protein 3 FlgL